MAVNFSAANAYAATQGLLSPGGAKPVEGIGAAQGAGTDFASMLRDAADGAAQMGRKADSAAMSAASGRADLVDVVTAVAESETALQTLVAVRDRMISAYEEIMRMPI